MNLLAYGTLMWPEVLEVVIGRCMEGVPATLHGYLRLRVTGELYPAIVPAEREDVEGILYTGLTDADFRHLDRFEGEAYDRVEVQVGDAVAQVYLLAEHWRHIAEERPWNPEHMRPEHLAAFCRE